MFHCSSSQETGCKDSSNPGNLACCLPVIELIQTDVSRYPFHQQPPTYLRAHRYRYWFTEAKADGSVSALSLVRREGSEIKLLFVCSSYPQRWWRRVYDVEFYPSVHLGHSFLESMLNQHGLKVSLLFFFFLILMNDLIRISSKSLSTVLMMSLFV